MNLKITNVNLKTQLTSVSVGIDIGRDPLQLVAKITDLHQKLQSQGYTSIEVTDYEDEPFSLIAVRAATHAEISQARETQNKWLKQHFKRLQDNASSEVESMTKSLQQTADEIPKLQEKLKTPGLSAAKLKEQQKQLDFILAKIPGRQTKLGFKQNQVKFFKALDAQGFEKVKEYLLKEDPALYEEIDF